jgi:phosphatidylserine decarboxylase
MKISKNKKRWGIILLLLAIIISLAFYPLSPQDPIQYYERGSGQKKTEKVAGEKWLGCITIQLEKQPYGHWRKESWFHQ